MKKYGRVLLAIASILLVIAFAIYMVAIITNLSIIRNAIPRYVLEEPQNYFNDLNKDEQIVLLTAVTYVRSYSFSVYLTPVGAVFAILAIVFSFSKKLYENVKLILTGAIIIIVADKIIGLISVATTFSKMNLSLDTASTVVLVFLIIDIILFVIGLINLLSDYSNNIGITLLIISIGIVNVVFIITLLFTLTTGELLPNLYCLLMVIVFGLSIGGLTGGYTTNFEYEKNRIYDSDDVPEVSIEGIDVSKYNIPSRPDKALDRIERLFVKDKITLDEFQRLRSYYEAKFREEKRKK